MTKNEMSVLFQMIFEIDTFTKIEAYAYILCKAEENPLGTSTRKLAETWNWSRSKVDNFLSYLSKMGVITIMHLDKMVGSNTIVIKLNSANYGTRSQGNSRRTPF